MPFIKGQSGNPAGRKPGSRNKFQEDFWRDLAKLWETEGAAALERVLKNDPSTFLRVAAGLLPKEEEHHVKISGVRRWTEAEWLAHLAEQDRNSETTMNASNDKQSASATDEPVRH